MEDLLAAKIKANEPLSPKEISNVLHVSRLTVTRQIHAGELKALLVGGQWRIWPSDLLNYVWRHMSAVSNHLDAMSRS